MRLFESSANGQTYGYFTDGTQDGLIEEAIKAGWRELTADEVAARAAPQPQAADPEQAYIVAVQKHLDDEARTRNYDGILSACTYASSTVAKFKSEGQACVAWRDAVWSACYDRLAQVKAGAVPMPTVEALIASLPEMTWPVAAE